MAKLRNYVGIDERTPAATRNEDKLAALKRLVKDNLTDMTTIITHVEEWAKNPNQDHAQVLDVVKILKVVKELLQGV